MATSTKSKAIKGESVTVSFHDSISVVKNQIRWTPKGVSLLTKWRFEEGAEVEFGFEHQGEKHRCCGVVVACEPLRSPAGCFSTVLFFVDAPCPKLHKAACACDLSPEASHSVRLKSGKSSIPHVLD